MGGKIKQAQRTKNNVRPSSSGRSAELLSSTVKDSTFLGLSSGNALSSIFPTLTSINLEQGLNSEYTLCFKKFNKKDPITKTKALQELLELVKNGNTDNVVAALPSWSHYYQIFTVDIDRKVRECAQACHAAIVRACGRRLAPQLRRLLPAWLLAAHDDHAPVQLLAHHSLTSTFPDGKLPEAITFCKAEIVALLLDNLIGNADMMLNKKIEKTEEKEMQMSLILASSLRALELLVRQLPRAHGAWLWDSLVPLLRSPAYWKILHSNQPTHVRCAWYAATGCLVQQFAGEGDRWGEFGARTCRALLALPERPHPPAAAQRCVALLMLMTSSQNWHTWLDKNDLLIKRILDVLEGGGWGDAKLLSNLMLPMLAHLPPVVLTKDFYAAFFQAIFAGLEKKNVMTSKSERQTWITNLADCLRYLSIQDDDYVLEITTNVQRTWLEKVLAIREDQARNNLIKHSATDMASLVKFWLKRSKEENSDKFDQLLRNFWQNVASTISAQISRLPPAGDDITRTIDSHVLLLQTLKCASAQEVKRQLSIKFADDNEVKPEIVTVHKTECDSSAMERYRHNLNETVERTCSYYLEFASEKQVSSAVLTPLMTLLIEYDSKNLFVTIARHFRTESVYNLYDEVLRGWLAGDTMRCKALADIVFLVLKYLSEEEKDSVFNSFQQFPPLVVEWCISLSLSHPYCAMAAVRRWLRGDVVEASVLALTARVAADGDGRAAALLLHIVSSDAAGESALREETVAKVAGALSAAMVDVCSPALELRVRTGAQLASALAAADAHAQHATRLAAALFEVALRVPRGDRRLPLDTWLEMRSSWHDALAALPGGRRQPLLHDMVCAAHRELFHDLTQLDTTKVEHIVSLLPYMVTSSQCPERQPSDAADIVELTKLLFDFKKDNHVLPVEMCALKCQCIMGDLNCPFDDDNDSIRRVVAESSCHEVAELDSQEFLLFAYVSLFRALYLRTLFLRETEDEDDTVSWCDTILSDVYFQEEFLKILHNFVIINTLCENYAFWPHYELIKKTQQRLDIAIDEIINVTSSELKGRLLATLSERAATKGYHWSYAGRFYENKIEKRETKSEDTSKETTDVDATNIENQILETITEPTSDSSVDHKEDDIHLLSTSEVVVEETNNFESKETFEVTENMSIKNMEIEEKANVSVFENGKRQVNPQNSNEHEKESEEVKCEDILDADKLQQIVTGNGFFHSLQANLKCFDDAETRFRTKYAVMVRSLYAAHVGERDVIDAQFVSDAARCQRTCDADVLVNLYYRHKHTMLYEREISAAPWAQVVSNSAAVDYLTELVATRGWDMPSHHWDFTNITLCSLVTSLHMSVSKLACTKVAMLCHSTAALFARVHEFVTGVRERSTQRRPSEHVLALATEWSEIFAPDLNGNLFHMLTTIFEGGAGPMSAGMAASLSALRGAAPRLQWSLLPAAQRGAALSCERVARAAAAALLPPAHAATQLLAYSVLRLMAKPLVMADLARLAHCSGAECDADEAWSPGALSLNVVDGALAQLHELADAALSNVGVLAAACEVVPFSDSHAVALGYLLLCVAAHEQCALATGDLVHHYAQLFRENKYVHHMMPVALRLLPAQLVAFANESGPARAPPACLHHFAATATATADLTLHEACSADGVSALACRALVCALGGPGSAAARGWWGAAGSRTARAVERVVGAAVAPRLLLAQVRALRERARDLRGAEVSIQMSTLEACCTVQVEEHPLQLCVQLSRLHPLVPPKVRCRAPVGSNLADTQWLALYLAYQNGTILNAFKMWISAVTSRIESLGQCYICYCLLQPTSARLPNAPCHQCRNKFHAACLRQWFTTSKKQECPVCRADFGKAPHAPPRH